MGTLQQRLDPRSQLRLRVFTFKILIIILVSAAIAAPRGYPLFALLSALCFWNSLFSGIAALCRRQDFSASHLTSWDEMVAFLAIAALMRSLAASMV